jgi:hypothetical protein
MAVVSLGALTPSTWVGWWSIGRYANTSELVCLLTIVSAIPDILVIGQRDALSPHERVITEQLDTTVESSH